MAASSPILRAIPEVGQTWDDPSEDLLFILFEDIESGQGTFLIVERTTDPSGQTYAQALRRDDGSYIVEHREGDAEHHYGTVVSDMRAAHQLLTGWAFQLPAWNHQPDWSQVRRGHVTARLRRDIADRLNTFLWTPNETKNETDDA